MISGWVAMARASPTRLRMPPEMSAGNLSPAPSSPTSASFSAAIWRISASGRFVVCRSGRQTLSSTFSHCSSAEPWNSTPKRRRIFSSRAPSASLTQSSPTHTRPRSGVSSRIMCRRLTLLPAPESPTITKVSPFAIS